MINGIQKKGERLVKWGIFIIVSGVLVAAALLAGKQMISAHRSDVVKELDKIEKANLRELDSEPTLVNAAITDKGKYYDEFGGGYFLICDGRTELFVDEETYNDYEIGDTVEYCTNNVELERMVYKDAPEDAETNFVCKSFQINKNIDMGWKTETELFQLNKLPKDYEETIYTFMKANTDERVKTETERLSSDDEILGIKLGCAAVCACAILSVFFILIYKEK